MSNINVLANFTKTYDGKIYKYTTMLRHKGVLIAFAMDDQRRIYYAVLDQSPETAESLLDVTYWPSGLTALQFPNEIAETGFGVADQALISLKDRPMVFGPDWDTKDDFYSTTARLTADAPFQVLTDGRYVYLFRQAIAHGHGDQGFKRDKNGELLRNDADTEIRIPLVDSTLLLDRFILSGTELQGRMEIRYQRSRSKTRPANRKDSLGAKDLDENPFFEPTQELKFLGHVRDGHFSVLLVPTAVAEVERWQFFVENYHNGRIDAFNVERSDDGLFNTLGSADVFAATQKGQAETALQFKNANAYIQLDKPQMMGSIGISGGISLATPDGLLLGSRFTLEAWIKPTLPPNEPNPLALISSEGTPEASRQQPKSAPSIWVKQSQLLFGFGDGDTAWFEYTTTPLLEKDAWNHIAVSFDGISVRFYVNGKLSEKTETADIYLNGILQKDPDEKPIQEAFENKPLHIHREAVSKIGHSEHSFRGIIDEIRIWNRARSSRELKTDLNQRLTGLEPGLAAYWRFDEAVGDTVFDQTNNSVDGTLVNIGIEDWVTSDAPIGENAGVNRNSFQIVYQQLDGTLVPRNVASGFSALLYFQQTNVPSGYDGKDKPLKQAARIMLAVATKAKDATAEDKNYIASLDFGVSASGKIALMPDRLPLKLVNAENTVQKSVNEQLDEMVAAQEQLRVLKEAKNKAKAKVEKRINELKILTDQQLDARVTAYEKLNYEGKYQTHRMQGLLPTPWNSPEGDTSFEFFNSLRIPTTLQVTLERQGHTAIILKDIPNLGFAGEGADDGISFLNMRAEGVQISLSPEFAAKFQKAQERLDLANRESNATTDLLVNAEAALATLQSVLRSGAEMTMPHVHIDAAGLSVSGGLLGFAWTQDAPLLFDSATGSLALYFRGAADQLFAAYYTTLTKRAEYPLKDVFGKQTVICQARSADLGMDKIKLVISEGPDASTCTVKITGLEIEETWTKVPRDPVRFARVLNGQAGHHESILVKGISVDKLVGYREMIGSGTIEIDKGQLNLKLQPGGLRKELKKNDALMLGNTRLIVIESAVELSTSVSVSSEVLAFPSEDQPVFYMEYDYVANAQTTKVPGDLFSGSLLLRALVVNDTTSSDNVADQLVTSGATLTSKWKAESPGSTLQFNGKDTLATLSNINNLKQFDKADDLTLEAWVRPTLVENKSHIIQHQSADTSYVLGLQKADLMTALYFDGEEDYIDLGESGVIVGPTFTLEAWIFPKEESNNATVRGIFTVFDTKTAVAERPPMLWVNGNNHLEGGFGDGTAWNQFTTPKDVLTKEAWNHVAMTYDGSVGPNSDRFCRIFVNGLLVHEENFQGKRPLNKPINTIGKEGDYSYLSGPGIRHIRPAGIGHLQAALDELRLWNRARSQAEILADMNRRLIGNETGLVGYWHFQDGEALDYSRNNNHGTLLGKPIQVVSPLPAYTVFAGVNGKFVQSKAIIPAGNWAHLAAVFVQDYNLKFDGRSHLDCGKADTLNINGDLTIEATLSLDQAVRRKESYIIGRGDKKQPYTLCFNQTGKLVFRFQNEAGNLLEFTSDSIVKPGIPARVGVTRKRETKVYTSDDGKLTKALSWYRINLYIGYAEAGTFIYAIDGKTELALKAIEIVENLKEANPDPKTRTPAINNQISDQEAIIKKASDKAPSDICRSDASTLIGHYFNGAISEVRIWNAARKPAEMTEKNDVSNNGLVSWWRFEEGDGRQAGDSIGQNHASFNGNILWEQDTNPQFSELALYHNEGEALETVNLAKTDILDLELSNQFNLGGFIFHQAKYGLYHGELEEVRIWKTARTREQMEDNLFRRINGELDDLIVYYTFDAETGTKLSDYGLRGNSLMLEGTADYVLSTAPIGDDAPIVRSALAGARTPFSGFIDGTPAVQEYGDMQMDHRGNMIGVFKRCYGFLKGGALNLLTGYKVGDLLVEWIGQVQFAPELMGFIEGAPPVPSENLTQPSVEMLGDLDDYNEASSVEFAQAEETTYTYTASKEHEAGLAIDTALKFGFKSESEAGGGFGFIALTKMEDNDFTVGVKASIETMWGWSSEASIGTTLMKGKTTSLELRGRFTTEDEAQKEPYNWKRFIPDNTGLALVQSETADVFALRLKHNNALISFSMRPNPDIPKDWNILHFPINPRYQKQGTLDGKIGPKADVDYPNALSYSPDSSYFKPVEAYALKNQIQKKEKALESYYSQFAAKDKGRKQQLSLDGVEAELRKKTNRNMVNTYVWTSDGGLYAETQQTMDVQTETSGGSYEFTGKDGLSVTANTTIFKAAVEFELNAMYIGHNKLSINKSKETQSSFQLNVSLDKVERDLYIREEDINVRLDKSDPKHLRPIKHEYKVDAYRFMTFFLEESSDHFDAFFDGIIDPIWIEQSDDPAARALRETRQQGKKPPCWRILHRVTYVSRVLPPFNPSAPPSMEKSLQTLDIESNYELIKQLEPYLSNKLGSFPEFTDAVRDTIKKNLPELQPHTEEVIKYMSLYFGIEGNQMPDQDAETALADGVPNQPPIVNAGQDQIIGLDGNVVESDLEAVAIDDRLQKTEAIFVRWEKTSGPEGVTFDDIHSVKTKVRFTNRGRYELKLTANDGQLEAEDTLIVIVNERPRISAGDKIETNVLKEVPLRGLIIDPGLGNPDDPKTSKVAVTWTKSDGLGTVGFDPSDTLVTKATFEKPGSYLLQLKVSNDSFTTTSEIMVSVAARVNKGIQALYTFEEGSGLNVQEVSGAGAVPYMEIPAPDLQKISWIEGGLKLNLPTVLAVHGSASRLAATLKASNEITLEAWLIPASANVPGLARILTFSNGPSARNFTLGQSGDKFHLHLRSNTTNENASDKALAGGIVEQDKLTHLVCIRDTDGLVQMIINRVPVATRQVDGDFSNWADDFQLAMGNEIGGGPERAWTGELHLIAIYSRALTMEEIIQNYDFRPNPNLPPAVSAGEDAVINWSDYNWSGASESQKKTFTLNGSVNHDRPTSSGNITWEQPGSPKNGVTIISKNIAKTAVEFTEKGRYIFRLKAQDGEMANSAETVVVVNVPPKVTVKPEVLNQHLARTGQNVNTDLLAELIDSGLGDGSDSVTYKWTWKNKTGNSPDLVFSDEDKKNTQVTIARRGLYALQLEVSNGPLKTNIPFAITVNEKPELMVVDAAPVVISTSNSLKIPVSVSKTGLGAPLSENLAFLWTVEAPEKDPGAVTFAPDNTAETTATFSKRGLYVLRLTATNRDNSELKASVDIRVALNSKPVVDLGPMPALVQLTPSNSQPYVAAINLEATVSDDGLPENPGKVMLKWTHENKGNNPSRRVDFFFGNTKDDTKNVVEARFTAAGTYLLQLEAHDGAESTIKQVTVNVP